MYRQTLAKLRRTRSLPLLVLFLMCLYSHGQSSGTPLSLSGGGASAIFPNTNANSSTIQTVQFTVTGAITVATVNASGDFSIADRSACALPLGQGGTCTLTVQFTPTAPGQRWALLLITDATDVKYSFGLAGFGIAPRLAFARAAVSFFAGNSVYGYSGDGGPALSASLASPFAIANDSAGSFYIADADNNVIRKIDSNGIITTVVGDGNCGYSGDGGAASSAEICWPSAVTVDAAGNLYIADSENCVIRKVDGNGIISTVAGNGAPGFNGDGGPATSASMGYPSEIAVDAVGNLYIGDVLNYRVWKVNTSGIISIFAGDGQDVNDGDQGPALAAGIGSPEGIALDNVGNVYFGDSDQNVIRKVNTSGTISTIAGTGTAGFSGDGGLATQAQLNYPSDLTVNSAGELLIVDANNCLIRKVDVRGVITTIAGTFCGATTSTARSQLHSLRALSSQRRGTRLQAKPAELQMLLATEVAWPPVTPGPFSPQALTMDASGNLYVTDFVDNVVVKVDFADPVGIDFGSVAVGNSSAPGEIILSNSGSADLQLSAISVAGNFLLAAQTGDCSIATPLPAGSGCPVHISFSPTTTGAIEGAAVITSDAINGPKSVPLTGEGLPAAPDFKLNTPAQLVVAGSGGTASATVTVLPSGGFSGTIQLACSGLPAHTTCAFIPAKVNALGDDAQLSSAVLIATGVSTVASAQPLSGSMRLAALFAAIPGLGLIGMLCVPGAVRSRRWHRATVLLMLVIALLASLSGCAGASRSGESTPGAPSTPAGTYSVTVTAASGAISHSAVIRLVVQ